MISWEIKFIIPNLPWTSGEPAESQPQPSLVLLGLVWAPALTSTLRLAAGLAGYPQLREPVLTALLVLLLQEDAGGEGTHKTIHPTCARTGIENYSVLGDKLGMTCGPWRCQKSREKQGEEIELWHQPVCVEHL